MLLILGPPPSSKPCSAPGTNVDKMRNHKRVQFKKLKTLSGATLCVKYDTIVKTSFLWNLNKRNKLRQNLALILYQNVQSSFPKKKKMFNPKI